ncbi:peptidase M28 [Pseudalgibacter alginicilyticus]|uniref:Peptidase M28 n=1 Tax=Pseudalgibacter alginicilyticus TaxID=1736674 RepID=A0A0P0CKA2_9FLAO|nr:M20/M25/M40 family metallo-hydrolase [Pseudalgibacter alginicilyticus]ALJ04834.1 peptidase M28 [Pseudalgibacter alginicilyticus]
MKKIFSLLVVVFVFGCGGQKQIISANSNSTKNSNHINLRDVKKNLEFLASDDLEGRKTGGKGIEKAAVFIENIFTENNIKPYFKTYRDTFNVKEVIGYNVVGFIEGNDSNLKNEFVILGAHYDHIGNVKTINGDSIANGANDDASGTVAVLEWAKYFSKTKTNKRSLLFTLYSAEEMGLKGSEHLAKRLKQANIDLYTMINFEMIGVPRLDNKIMSYLTGYEKSNMAETLNNYGGTELVGFLPKANEFKLFRRSDNFPFYKAFKVPAHAISTFDFTNFDYYHHVDDEADNMDLIHMTYFMNKMIPALEGMINADTKEIKINNE